MSSIKVVANKIDNSVVCTFPNGDELEIEMIDAWGDESVSAADVDSALEMLQSHLRDKVKEQLGYD
jgi:hypothetical protein